MGDTHGLFKCGIQGWSSCPQFAKYNFCLLSQLFSRIRSFNIYFLKLILCVCVFLCVLECICTRLCICACVCLCGICKHMHVRGLKSAFRIHSAFQFVEVGSLGASLVVLHNPGSSWTLCLCFRVSPSLISQ